ncbi:MAG: hypothetical protein D6705_06900 [Deltaproteobacteria bacterium]|nr:MAG: hypothetical protein D6705_06900 [Deltaproteobacteria bacterium]
MAPAPRRPRPRHLRPGGDRRGVRGGPRRRRGERRGCRDPRAPGLRRPRTRPPQHRAPPSLRAPVPPLAWRRSPPAPRRRRRRAPRRASIAVGGCDGSMPAGDMHGAGSTQGASPPSSSSRSSSVRLISRARS